MINQMHGEEVAGYLQESLPGAIERFYGFDLWIDSQSILTVCKFMRESEELEFDLLNSISAVDYVEYFELVYHLTSTVRRRSAVLKSRLIGRDQPTAPSVINVWKGADFQEREIWDLMGIFFVGHPNMKRIMLWDGFPGHPLRKDYLESPR